MHLWLRPQEELFGGTKWKNISQSRSGSQDRSKFIHFRYIASDFQFINNKIVLSFNLFKIISYEIQDILAQGRYSDFS